MTANNIVIMGVAGCGKSHIGQALAAELGIVFIEGDSFHPPENIALMSAGTPLDDKHRQGWLETLAARLAASRADGSGSVLACSALKRRYRDILRAADPDILFVHLAGSVEQIAPRMQQRSAHFMPSSLLASQFADLEPPSADENALTVNVEDTPQTITRSILDRLSQRPGQ
ncbi:gluconokinase [Vogesella sp. LIG4]|uniref:gluconokinase n=1 Tax=Vogesella sp. LIG4 TaxID=1192162 RepID=UPI00081F988F|nr:gluconokinase [Vogesella sp. LIG4]SCK22521.1 gluconate kinase, SKI family [Vogesella sp. LIG4]